MSRWPCGHVESTPLAGLDEAAPTGERGADVLAVAEGERVATVEWASGETTHIRVALSYADGEILFHDAERDVEDWRCDHVSVVVRLDVSTDDGAVDAETECAIARDVDGGVGCATWLVPPAQPAKDPAPGEDSPAPPEVDLELYWIRSELTGWIRLADDKHGTGEIRPAD